MSFVEHTRSDLPVGEGCMSDTFSGLIGSIDEFKALVARLSKDKRTLVAGWETRTVYKPDSKEPNGQFHIQIKLKTEYSFNEFLQSLQAPGESRALYETLLPVRLVFNDFLGSQQTY